MTENSGNGPACGYVPYVGKSTEELVQRQQVEGMRKRIQSRDGGGLFKENIGPVSAEMETCASRIL
jgi:hypothetical protein